MRIEPVEEWTDPTLPKRVRIRIGVIYDTRQVFVVRQWVVSRDEGRHHQFQVWSEQQSMREMRLAAARERAEELLNHYRKQWEVDGDGRIEVKLTAGRRMIVRRPHNARQITMTGLKRHRVRVSEVHGDTATRHLQVQHRELFGWKDVGRGVVAAVGGLEEQARRLLLEYYEQA